MKVIIKEADLHWFFGIERLNLNEKKVMESTRKAILMASSFSVKMNNKTEQDIKAYSSSINFLVLEVGLSKFNELLTCKKLQPSLARIVMRKKFIADN